MKKLLTTLLILTCLSTQTAQADDDNLTIGQAVVAPAVVATAVVVGGAISMANR